MNRERALKVVLVLVGLLFTAGVYPLIGSLLHPADSDSGDTMMLSLYVALGIFLLIAVRNPFAHLCSCGRNVHTGTRNSEPTRRISGRIGCARCDRHSANCAGSGKADSRASIGSHNIALPQTT